MELCTSTAKNAAVFKDNAITAAGYAFKMIHATTGRP